MVHIWDVEASDIDPNSKERHRFTVKTETTSITDATDSAIDQAKYLGVGDIHSIIRRQDEWFWFAVKETRTNQNHKLNIVTRPIRDKNDAEFEAEFAKEQDGKDDTIYKVIYMQYE